MTRQVQCHVELGGFDDLARYACALREHPCRVYSHLIRKKRVLSSTLRLSNTLVVFWTEMPGEGRYVSYRAGAGREECRMAGSTKGVAKYAPIIHMEKEVVDLPVRAKNLPDRLHPVEVSDLGSLARLTYDPDSPENPDPALYCLKRGRSWMVGRITSLEMDAMVYSFNHVRLNSEPAGNFLRYRGHRGQDPEFTDSLDHGYMYLPLIRIKGRHQIFGI